MLKKIIISPDSFKGTMTSIEICDYIEEIILNYIPQAQVVKIPIADGGEGTVDAYLSGVGGTRVSARVTGPMGEKTDAEYGILPDKKTAVIEMAAASGLPLVQGDLFPLDATTYGTGELIADAAKNGCTRIILGIGGSATTDGGIGALGALGVRFLDAEGKEVTLDGKGLGRICTVDAAGIADGIKRLQITIACDVKNPLAGKNGAAYVFAPQKGADAQTVEMLDKNLLHYNEILTKYTGVDYKDKSGMGAAGGLGLSLTAFLHAETEAGIELILDTAGFSEKVKGADLVITGEGKIDGQSKQGKVPVGVARRAKRENVPVIALVGDVGAGYEELYDEGITAIFSTNKAAVPYSEAKKTSVEDLKFLTESLMRFYNVIK
ncbi:MAG: glycerate kinase [Christensenella sp.]